jgi:hypothetical protein
VSGAFQASQEIEMCSAVTLPASIWDGHSSGFVSLSMYHIETYIN